MKRNMLIDEPFIQVDYSIPYKTFEELKDNDKIFFIDYKEFSIKEYQITDIKKRTINQYDVKNQIEIEFKIPELNEYDIAHIYNANSFIEKIYYHSHYGTYVTTDKRIIERIFDIIKDRNTYQWNVFSSIFGHPLSGKYEPRHIKLK